jgi:hypothetical protein
MPVMQERNAHQLAAPGAYAQLSFITRNGYAPMKNKNTYIKFS